MIRGQMRIAQDHGRIRVPEKLANGVQRYTRLHQPAGKVMPQIMEAKIFQLRSLSQPPPRTIDTS
jgi:hypothetical protein